MQQDLDGRESPAVNPADSQSITQLCSDPGKTRDRAEVGELNVPCHRCLAFDPRFRRSCLFLEKGDVQMHHYVPDYQAMGDCRRCGHIQDDPAVHFPPRRILNPRQLTLPTDGTIRRDDEE